MSAGSGTRSWNALFSSRLDDDFADTIAAVMGDVSADGIISFSGGFPDPDTLPVTALSGLTGQVITEPAALQYAPTQGLPGLRNWLAQKLEEVDGLAPADEELLITSGGMEGLQLLNTCLVDPGDAVAVEAPSFLGAIMMFRNARAEIRTTPLRESGVDVDQLVVQLRAAQEPPKFLYVIPDYQNPTGVSMTLEARHALVDLARRHGMPVVEDVAYRELGFGQHREPSLRSLAPDVVAQVGTFSKTFIPGARLGWIAAPHPLVERLTAAKQSTDQCAGALGQRLLEKYGRSGKFDEGVRHARDLYHRRCRLMVRTMAENFPDEVRFTKPAGGFFTWVMLPERLDSEKLQERAREHGITFVPGRAFYPDGRGAHEFRLSFSKVPDNQIPEGIARLGAILTDEL